MTHKNCPKCKESKPFSEFHKDSSKKHGIGSYCKPCAIVCSAEYYTNNSGRIRQRVTVYAKSHPRSNQRGVMQRLKSLVTAAKGRKWLVEITFDTLIEAWDNQNGLCAYSGLPLTCEANQLNTISLDRIDSKIGYVEGNVQLVCAMVNRMKQDYAETDFVTMCRNIAENTKSKTTQDAGPRLDNDYADVPDLLILDSVLPQINPEQY